MKNFLNTQLDEIYQQLLQELQLLSAHAVIEFEVLNPDIAPSLYNGEMLTLEDGSKALYRGYKTWLDMAHLLECRMLTPQIYSKNSVLIRFQKLAQDSFHAVDADKETKYGVESLFSHIVKNEEIAFLHYYTQALHNVKVAKRRRILNLGVNQGDEFDVIKKMVPAFETLELVGVDYCASAVQHATRRYADDKNVTFYEHDITQLHTLNLGTFDLIISIGTLQSSNLKMQSILMNIVQNHLKKDGSMILGFPNCRWRDGEMLYGARMRNYTFSEMSNLYKDVVFCKKYLQQKKFRVTVTGKDYIFVTATSIR